MRKTCQRSCCNMKKRSQTNAKIRLYIVDCAFKDLIDIVEKYPNVIHVKDIKNVPTSNNIKIIPFDSRDFIRFSQDGRLLFKTDIEAVDTLNDKCVFAMFMMKYFPENIPRTIYVNRLLKDNTKIEYIYNNYIDNSSLKMIEKEADGCAGLNIFITNTLNKKSSNVVVSRRSKAPA